MSPAKLSRRGARMAQIAAAVAELEDRGTCWDAWARELGLSRQAVINVRKNRAPCWTGESRKAADLILADARRAAVPTESETGREADTCRQRIALSACEETLAFLRERIALFPNPDGFCDAARIDRALDLARRALRGEAA